MGSRRIALVFLLVFTILSAEILKETELKPFMFTESITGDVSALKPSAYGYSEYWPFPVEVYEITMMRAKHQFLPSKFPQTEIFAYAGKVNGKLVPSYPGPTLSVLKNMPCYVIYTNDIGGSHILPVDTSPPFDMVAQFQNEVPVVPHAHGLETEMGPDGQPMGFWTKSGRKGPDFFSLKSQNKKPNQAIFRYHNTKEGLFWYHDHAMAITRLNVYAGLVGLYEIIDPQISSEESNILKIYGDVERKYFAIVDKTFRQNGQLFYPDKADSSDFQYWVPEFFGNTLTVNGKVWPKVSLRPKIYRLVLLNGCQSRFLNIYFQNGNRKLDFQIFRRDSDFLRNPVTVKEHLLLLGGRIEIFLDLTNVEGEVMLRNDAATPFPMGDPPNEFMQQIMKIVVSEQPRFLQQQQPISLIEMLKKKSTTVSDTIPSQPIIVSPPQQPIIPIPQQIVFPSSIVPKPVTSTGGTTFLSKIQDKMNLYTANQNNLQSSATLDFLDESQAANYNTPSQTNSKPISIVDFINSNDQNAIDSLVSTTKNMQTKNLESISLVNQNVNSQRISIIDFLRKQNSRNINITNVPYPRFGAGKPYFTILTDVQNSRNELSGVMIDGVPVRMGCKGSSFQNGGVYDFYIINLTMDDHPIHIHLINFQVISRFGFNVKKYKKDWQNKNGQLKAGGVSGIPQQIDVRPYKIPNSEQPPLEEQKQFLDVILVPSEKVTVARVKFSNHYGKSFPFDVSGARYVWHCHILEHEDNEMMRYFCVE